MTNTSILKFVILIKLVLLTQEITAQNCFDIGSSQATVRKVQGTPTSVNNFGNSENWSYSLSTVNFKNGKVNGYNDFSTVGGAKLRICDASTPQGNYDNPKSYRTYENTNPLGSGLNKSGNSGYLSNEDVGFDPFIGKATNNVNMRFGPSTSYESMGTVAFNSLLYILSSETIAGFYKVIDISSAEVGWIHKNYINFYEAVEVKSGGNFRSTGFTTGYKPQISIKNSSRYNIKLILGNTIHELRPYTSKDITTSVGNTSYIATAAGVKPISGVQNFEARKGYEWEFWVSETRY